MFSNPDDTTLVRFAVTCGTVMAVAAYAFPFMLIATWLVIPG